MSTFFIALETYVNSIFLKIVFLFLNWLWFTTRFWISSKLHGQIKNAYYSLLFLFFKTSKNGMNDITSHWMKTALSFTQLFVLRVIFFQSNMFVYE